MDNLPEIVFLQQQAYDLIKNLYQKSAYILFLYFLSILFIHFVSVLFCVFKKKAFKNCQFNSVSISLVIYCVAVIYNIQISFLWILAIFCCWLLCVILEQSILHGGFIWFMKFLVIKFYHIIKNLKNAIQQIEQNKFYENLIAFTATIFLPYVLLFQKHYITNQTIFLMGFVLCVIIFISLPKIFKSARGLASIWILSIVLCNLSLEKTVYNNFSNMILTTIVLSIVWSITALVAEQECSKIVISFFSFITAMVTVVVNIFLLIFLPYLERLSQIYPELSNEVSAVSAKTAFTLNIIFVPMLIAVNFASFLKELQSYTEHLTKDENSQL